MAANIQVDTITDTAGTGATNFSQGLTVSATKSVKTDILIPQTSGKSIGIKGVTDGSAATVGDIGEVISSSSSATPVASTYVNVASISLTAGDWDITGLLLIGLGTATSVTQLHTYISTTSAGVDSFLYGNNLQASTFPASVNYYIAPPRRPLSISSTTTVYLIGRIDCSAVGTATFSSSSNILARRVR